MKEKIALGVCLALTLVCAVGSWPEALFWSVPSNRHINQLNVFSHPLSLIWHWSLVVLPIPVALGFTRFRVSLVIAMALVLYTPIYLVWATLFTQHYRLAPGPLVWIVLFIITLAFELVFITRLKQLRKSNNRLNPISGSSIKLPEKD